MLNRASFRWNEAESSSIRRLQSCICYLADSYVMTLRVSEKKSRIQSIISLALWSDLEARPSTRRQRKVLSLCNVCVAAALRGRLLTVELRVRNCARRISENPQRRSIATPHLNTNDSGMQVETRRKLGEQYTNSCAPRGASTLGQGTKRSHVFPLSK